MKKDGKTCEICGSSNELTVHHLVPQLKCKNKYKQLRSDDGNLAILCRQCHDQIHALWTENELRDVYNSVEKMLGNEEFARFAAWRKKHQNYNGHSKMSNQRKRK